MISAVIGMAVLSILIYVNFLRHGGERKDQEARQRAADKLSDYITEATTRLLNPSPPVQNDDDVEKWATQYQHWCEQVNTHLEKNFSKSEWDYFHWLGSVQSAGIEGALNYRHNNLMLHLHIRIGRLRDIIRDNQNRG